MTITCAVCHRPITNWSDFWGVVRVVVDGELFEGMYAVHAHVCLDKHRQRLAAFDAELPSADDVRGILS